MRVPPIVATTLMLVPEVPAARYHVTNAQVFDPSLAPRETVPTLVPVCPSIVQAVKSIVVASVPTPATRAIRSCPDAEATVRGKV